MNKSDLVEEIAELHEGILELYDSFYQTMKSKISSGDKTRMLEQRAEMQRRFAARQDEHREMLMDDYPTPCEEARLDAEAFEREQNEQR